MELSELYKIADYKDDKGMLFNGDCLEIMKNISNNSIDLVLTDPPYGIDLTPQRNGGKFKDTKIKNDDNLDWLDY